MNVETLPDVRHDPEPGPVRPHGLNLVAVLFLAVLAVGPYNSNQSAGDYTIWERTTATPQAHRVVAR